MVEGSPASSKLTELVIATAAVVMTLALPIFSTPPASAEVNSESTTSGSTLRVEGVGDGPSGEVGKTLQGATSIPQSGDVDSKLQNPDTVKKLQPNSGQSSFSDSDNPQD